MDVRTGQPDGVGPQGQVETVDPERERIRKVYDRYRSDGREAERWDDQDPGNRCILRERDAVARRLLAGRPSPRRVLEVGCGRGSVMRRLSDLLGPDVTVFGVDLLVDRLADAAGSGCPAVCADGRRLPFRDDEFDLVVVYTVFSSILDSQVRSGLAREIDRVVGPAGAVLWYDLRLPSLNRAVRPVRRAEISRVFSGSAPVLESVTLLPPLARIVAARSTKTYGRLARLPFLRSHLMGLIVRPSRGGV